MGAQGERAAERPTSGCAGEHRSVCSATATASVSVATRRVSGHDRGSDDATDEPSGPKYGNECTGNRAECGDASNDGRGDTAETAYADGRGLDDAPASTGARACGTRHGAAFA